MRAVLKITVTVKHSRIHKKYPLPYHTATEINVRVRHGNGNGNINVREWYGNGNGNKRSRMAQKRNGNRKMAKIPTLSKRFVHDQMLAKKVAFYSLDWDFYK